MKLTQEDGAPSKTGARGCSLHNVRRTALQGLVTDGLSFLISLNKWPNEHF